VPKAMHALYEASGAPLEPTAVLVCLESGPHLAFFLDGRLELAIDPPIALEGDRPTVPVILDQIERGTVYFRQQFRGTSPARILLAARADQYEQLASNIESRLGARVKPLFAGDTSPEAVVAMGAVLESRAAAPLDLYPHPPSASDRIGALMRGPNAVMSAAVAAAVIAVAWSAVQYSTLASTRRENERMRQSVRAAVPAVEPMRQIAERRAGVMRQVDFVRLGLSERSTLARTLAGIATSLPEGIVFDSLAVARSNEGWAVKVAGVAQGNSAAQAVGALQSFQQSLRSRPAVRATALENFDYIAADSLATILRIQFHLSFTVKRTAEATP
jgi:hypothetical protein